MTMPSTSHKCQNKTSSTSEVMEAASATTSKAASAAASRAHFLPSVRLRLTYINIGQLRCHAKEIHCRVYLIDETLESGPCLDWRLK